MAAAETATAARMFLDIDPNCVSMCHVIPPGEGAKGVWGRASLSLVFGQDCHLVCGKGWAAREEAPHCSS